MDEEDILVAVDDDIAERYRGKSYIVWMPLLEQLVREARKPEADLEEIRAALDWGFEFAERKRG